jgi:hypothetical protein
VLSRYKAAFQAADITGLFTYRPKLAINNLRVRERRRTIAAAVTRVEHMLRRTTQKHRENWQKKAKKNGALGHRFIFLYKQQLYG